MNNKKSFGFMPDGTEVFSFTLKNKSGAKAEVLTYGGILNSVYVPDKNGEYRDVLIGFDTLEGHLNHSDYQGMIVGPFANRIAGGKVPVGDKVYQVECNENGITCLHSGGDYSHAVWNGVLVEENTVKLTYTSPDGKFGFPGNIKNEVTYTLTDENAVEIHYIAVSDKDTVISLTNHSYFNLNGFDGGDVSEHVLQIEADYYTPTNANNTPTGEIKAVENTPCDFRISKALKDVIDADDDQIIRGRGFDHNFCIKDYDGAVRRCAEAYSEKSGIALTVYTDMPGVQLYTGGFLSGAVGKGGKTVDPRTGFCFETQFYPDTMNRPQFPSCEIMAGETYDKTTIFAFSVK